MRRKLNSLERSQKLMATLVREGALGVVVGIRLRSGATMTIHRGDLSGLSSQLRECITDSRAEMRAKAES